MTYDELTDFLNEHNIDFDLQSHFPNSVYLRFELTDSDDDDQQGETVAA